MTAELVKPTNTVTKPALTAESDRSRTRRIECRPPAYQSLGTECSPGTRRASPTGMNTQDKERPLVAAKRRGRTASSAASGRKTASKRKAGKTHDARVKDPRGGLTAAGRAAFHRKDGSNLKPG